MFILFIILNSFLDGKESNNLFNEVLELINIYNVDNKTKLFLRKLIGHFLCYFSLGICLIYLFKNKQLLFFIIGILLSIITEYIQHFIPSRYFSLNDIFINILGFLLPLFIYNILFYKELFIYEMGNNVGECSINSFTSSSILR